MLSIVNFACQSLTLKVSSASHYREEPRNFVYQVPLHSMVPDYGLPLRVTHKIFESWEEEKLFFLRCHRTSTEVSQSSL